MNTNQGKATLSIVAQFPEGTFLENLAVRSDNSLLVSSLKAHEVWYVPPVSTSAARNSTIPQKESGRC